MQPRYQDRPSAQTLCGPQGVAVDAIGNLYVSDSGNSRVLEYNTPLNAHSGEHGAGDTLADVVFGQKDFSGWVCFQDTLTPSAANLCIPKGVTVDSFGNLYVADGNRLLEYNTPLNLWSGEPGAGDTVADFVLGQPDFTANNDGCASDGLTPNASTYCDPAGIAVDALGDLYVSDNFNNRILEYNAPTGSHLTPDRVFGQPSFSGNNCNAGTAPRDIAGIGPDSLCLFGIVPGVGLAGLAIDPNLNVYASDFSNSRLLVYNNPPGVPILTATPTGTPVAKGSATATPTPSGSPIATPTATAIPGHPFIISIPNPILVGTSFLIKGTGFTPGSVVNFFVSTASGPTNTGPFIPRTKTSTSLNVSVPASNILGQGLAAVQVVNTEQDYVASNIATAQLYGLASAGIPSLTSINGVGLTPTTGSAPDNVETVAVAGNLLSLGGSGFDVTTA